MPNDLMRVTNAPLGDMPDTYGELRLYTIDVLGQLAQCNLDKRKTREALQ